MSFAKPLTNSKIFQKFFSNREDILTNVGYLAFFMPSITDPIIYHLTVRKNDHFKPEQKKTMISQNWSHHSFNLALEIVSLLLSKPIIKMLFKGSSPGDLKFYGKVGGFLAMIFAKSFIRPFVMIKFAEKEKGDKKKPVAQTVPVNAPRLDINSHPAFTYPQNAYNALNLTPYQSQSPYINT